MTRISSFGLSLGLALLLATGAQGGDSEPAKQPEPYAPGLGDFMTAYVQPHHIKLWLAGRAQNWPLAEYEAKELRETFEDVATYQAVWHDFQIANAVKTTLEPLLSAVDQAIKDRSETRFGKAYGQLTEGCTACHRATANPAIVIQVPSAAAFPDQVFSPRKP